MPVLARVALFVGALVVVFGAALGAGRAVGPIATEDPAAEHGGDHGGDHDRVSLTPVGAEGAEGAGDFALALERPTLPAGPAALALRILDADGAAVTSYDVEHEKLLHLVLVRDDLGGYRHLHPTLDEATGRWTVRTELPAGRWRVYADFSTGGTATLAEADLTVTGEGATTALGPDTTTATVDGYTVHLDRPDGATAFHVSRDGRPVTDLQPYLGAYGHLVAIRAGTLDYLHVHPEEGGPGPEVGFHAEFEEGGRYRLFLDFRHGGRVRTAVFTLTEGGDAAGGNEARPDEHGEEEGGHEH